MNEPLTKEYLEAQQHEINKRNKNFIKTLSLKDKKRFQAIEQATQILDKNDVAYEFFVICPYLNSNKIKDMPNAICDGAYSYGNLNRYFLKFDKKEKPTINSLRNLKKAQSMLCVNFFSRYIASAIDKIIPKLNNRDAENYNTYSLLVMEFFKNCVKTIIKIEKNNERLYED